MNDLKDALSRELEEHITLTPNRKKKILDAMLTKEESRKNRKSWQYPIVLTSFSLLLIFFVSMFLQGGASSTLPLTKSDSTSTNMSIKDGDMAFQTAIEVNGFAVFMLLIALAMLMIVLKLKNIKNPYSKTLFVAIGLMVLATWSLGSNYVASLGQAQEGIRISNLLAYFLIGEGSWSREGFAGIFSYAMVVLIILLFMYLLLVIVESGHKWRWQIAIGFLSAILVGVGFTLYTIKPLQMTVLTTENDGSLYVDVVNTGYFPIKIKEVTGNGTVQHVKLLASSNGKITDSANTDLLQINVNNLAVQPEYVEGTIKHYGLYMEDAQNVTSIEVHYSYLGFPLKKIIENTEE